MASSNRWWLTRLGAAVVILGTGPLAVTMLLAKLGVTSDPNPNPVAFGILAMLTFWPGVLAIIGGVFLARSKK